jgi:hypothetical protein
MNDPPRRLLILACTATKRHDPNPMPALLRYNGPSFRTLRKWQSDNADEAQQIDILVLSTKLGLIAADTQIEDYDQRMTPERAAALQPVVNLALHQFLAKHGPYAATLVHRGQAIRNHSWHGRLSASAAASTIRAIGNHASEASPARSYDWGTS